jgi:hypothetical protein
VDRQGLIDDFYAGKYYLRVSRDEWQSFARWCRMHGIEWGDQRNAGIDVRSSDAFPVAITSESKKLYFTSGTPDKDVRDYEAVFGKPEKPPFVPSITITLGPDIASAERSVDATGLMQHADHTFSGSWDERAIRVIEELAGTSVSIFTRLAQAEAKAKALEAVKETIRRSGI